MVITPAEVRKVKFEGFVLVDSSVIRLSFISSTCCLKVPPGKIKTRCFKVNVCFYHQN